MLQAVSCPSGGLDLLPLYTLLSKTAGLISNIFNMLAPRRLLCLASRAQRCRSFATTTSGPLNLPHVIKLFLAEQQQRQLSPRNLEAAVRHMHGDGLVVVEDAVPLNDLDHLNRKMVQDARTLQARGKDGPFNYNQGNLQQDAPPVAEYFSTSVFASTSSPFHMYLRLCCTSNFSP